MLLRSFFPQDLRLKRIRLKLRKDRQRFINKLEFKAKMESKNCSSCKKKIDNDKGNVIFKCPQCGDIEIVRCKVCRSNATKYHCACGFTGPN